MDSLERYLRQATRGLWGRKRAEVREELEAHILERARAFEVGGLSKLEAVEKVLAELGRPEAVSAGMVRLHSWPRAALVTSLMGLMAAGLLMVQAQSYEVVAATITPIPSCVANPSSLVCKQPGMAWIRFEEVRKALEPQGVRFERAFGRYTLRFPGTDQVTTWTNEYEGTFNQEKLLPDYLPFQNLVIRFAQQTKMTVRLEGWEKPRAWFGDRVSLGLAGGNANLTHVLYSSLLMQQPTIWDRLVGQNPTRNVRWQSVLPSERSRLAEPSAFGRIQWYRHRIQVGGGAGGVWGVLMPSVGEGLNNTRFINLYTDIAPSKDGFVELYLPDESVLFVDSFDQASRAVTGGVSTAVLYDLSQPYTKDGWSKAIVVPQNPVSKAVR